MTGDPIRRLPTNAVNNLAAIVVAFLPALLATPFIVHRLGEERFGIYLLALSVSGIGGLLDLGLTPASVKFVAECRASGDEDDLSVLINTLVLTRMPLALVAALAGIVSAPWVCTHLLAVSPQLLGDAVFVVRASMLTLAVSMFGGTFAALLRGVHRFDLASKLGMGLALALTGATVGVLALGLGLRAIAVAELFLNLLYLVASAWVARRLLPGWRVEMTVGLEWVRRLSGFGAFVILNSLTGFVYLHLNRILLGRALGAGAVPFLAIPWGLGARITQVVNALTEAITPVASELAAGRESETLQRLYMRSMRVATIAAMTLVVPLVVSARDLLSLWLGPSFSEKGATALQILAVSAGIQSLGAVPYFILNGVGRPAAANLPPVVGAGLNVALAFVFLHSLGLEGIAAAILCGIVVQTTILILALDRALHLEGGAARAFLGPLALSALAAALSLQVAADSPDVLTRFFVRGTAAVGVLHGLFVATGCYGRREIDLITRALFPTRSPGLRTPAGPSA